MSEYIPIVWLLLAVLFPAAFLIFGITNFKKKARIREVFFKVFVAFLSYAPVTILCAVYVASLINSVEDTKGISVDGVRLTPFLDSVSLGLISGHLIFGLFLCWFISKDLTKILAVLMRNKQKIQSIFDTK